MNKIIIIGYWILTTTVMSNEKDFEMHIDILKHENTLNSSSSTKGYISINHHTRSYITRNAHLYVAKIQPLLEVDESEYVAPKRYCPYVILLIQKNKKLMNYAKKRGFTFNINSYGDKEIKIWRTLLKDYPKTGK